MSELENTVEIPTVQEPKHKKPKKLYTKWSIALTILAILLNIALIAELFYVTKYSTLSKDLFIKANIVVMVAVLVLDILVFIAIRLHNKVFLGIMTAVIIAFGAIAGYAGYALTRVDTNIKEITAEEHTTEVDASIVLYNMNSGEPILEVNDLVGRKVAVVTGTDTETIIQENLAALNINVEYVSYNSYAEAFRGLISGETSAAALRRNYSASLGTDADLIDYIADTTVLATYTKEITTQAVTGSEKDIANEPFTVLITGENEGLADTIIIASVNPISMNVTLTSIARDSYVPITCYGSSSKINAAHAVSEACMVDTVETLTGIDIDFTVEFNFASVIQVIDAVGGLDVYNPVQFDAQEWDIPSNSLTVETLYPGELHLTGQQALGWLRERYAFEDGDFARQQHQQEAIVQVMSKIMATRNPNVYLDILDAAGANIKTNISETQMVNFLTHAMNKAKRYYNSDNPAGVFNITTSRITGYNGQMWHDGLGQYLYIYQLYNGAISDAYSLVQNNISLTSTPSAVTGTTWDAGVAYTAPTAIADYYYESVNTVIGGPTTETTVEETPAETQSPEYIPDTPTEDVPSENPSDTTGGEEVVTPPVEDTSNNEETSSGEE